MIYLGEAVHCEHEGAYGYEGASHIPGNQTGDELRIAKFYRKPWAFCFRATDENVANAMAIRMKQACANMHIGYSQPAREGFHNCIEKDADPSHINTDVDTDCSALVNTIARITWKGIGHNPPMTGLERTAEMHRVYSAMPQYFDDITDKVNLDTGYGLKVGDIVFRPASHTAMVVSVTSEVNKNPLYVGVANRYCAVYKTSKSRVKLKAWPSLSTGNLVDVCDERNGRLYVRIGQVYGWVKASCIDKY